MDAVLEKVKRINISSKRQVTLPQAFYMALEFTDEADCFVRDNEIIIRPVNKNITGEYDDLILADLIKEGYEGQELLQKFRETKAKICPAVQALLKDTERQLKENKLYSIKDVFGD